MSNEELIETIRLSMKQVEQDDGLMEMIRLSIKHEIISALISKQDIHEKLTEWLEDTDIGEKIDVEKMTADLYSNFATSIEEIMMDAGNEALNDAIRVMMKTPTEWYTK